MLFRLKICNKLLLLFIGFIKYHHEMKWANNENMKYEWIHGNAEYFWKQQMADNILWNQGITAKARTTKN